MEPIKQTTLEQPAFPLGINVRRMIYWATAVAMLVSTYLGAREIIDALDMAFITGLGVLVTGMAGVNMPKQADGTGTPLVEDK